MLSSRTSPCYLRIVLQTLQDLGYEEIRETLERESGVHLYEPLLLQLRELIANGAWDQVLDSLATVCDEDDIELVQKHVLLTAYSELLSAGETERALHFLQNDLAPVFSSQQDTLCQLCIRYLFASNFQTIKLDGNVQILDRDQLSSFVLDHSRREMRIPSSCFDRILHEWIELKHTYQYPLLSRSINPSVSLRSNPNLVDMLSSYPGTKSFLHIDLVTSVHDHSDEVWIASFSADHYFLATAGCDGNVFVYNVEDLLSKNVRPLYTLNHENRVTSLSWVEGGHSSLYTCSGDVLLWNLSQEEDEVSSEVVCAGRMYETVICRTKSSILTSSCSDRFSRPPHVLLYDTESMTSSIVHRSYARSACMFDAGNSVVVLDATAGVIKYSLTDEGSSDPYIIIPGLNISSMSGSSRANELLIMVSRSNQATDIQRWSVSNRGEYLHSYQGLGNEMFSLSPCFIGEGPCSLVACGSSDTNIYIWASSGKLIGSIGGHSGVVNCVASIPYPDNDGSYLFASVSDDRSLKLWRVRMSPVLPSDVQPILPSSDSVPRTSYSFPFS